MATHAHDFGRAEALPLSAVLAAIPSYPRAVIERLVSRLIDQLDEADDDPDLEDGDQDLCLAGDDGVFSGPVIRGWNEAHHWALPGADEDAEMDGVAGPFYREAV